MNPKLKKLIAFVVVISTILIVGGIVYTSFLGVENKQYTKTTATIAKIESEQTGEHTFVVKGATVTYDTPQGTKTNKLQGILILPPRLEEGAEVEVRFKNEDVDYVTSEMINWLPAVFLLVLGVLYAVGGAMLIVFRKKAGYYAIVEQNNDPLPIEDDGFSIADQIEKMEQEEMQKSESTLTTEDDNNLNDAE